MYFPLRAPQILEQVSGAGWTRIPKPGLFLPFIGLSVLPSPQWPSHFNIALSCVLNYFPASL